MQILAIVILIFFLGVSCKKFVQLDPPSSKIVTASVFNNSSAATSAVTVIYSQMLSESWNMSQNSGLLSDELVSSSTSSFVFPYYTNTLLANSSPMPGPWQSAYNYIYQANAAMEGLTIYGGGGEAFRRQLTGEAKFIRAFWYFYLTNCYGDVPLSTTTDYKENSILVRASKTKVYQQIINDLQDAKNLLDTNYVDATDTVATLDRIRPTKWAATALLARVYLYTKSFSDAEAQATMIISNNKYSLVPDLNNVFLKNSKEAIWQLGMPSPVPSGTQDARNFILSAAPNSGSTANVNTVIISPTLLNSFDSADKRKSSWIGSITTIAPVATYYFPYKYKNTTTSPKEYVMMLRLAEQYLIRAEARVQQNKDLDKAVIDINAIRGRAGLPDYAGPLNRDSLLNAILHERQTEFFVEWGHRWFDLIRTDNVNAVMNVVAPQKGGKWRPELALYPIPRNEILLNFNLTQNDGY